MTKNKLINIKDSAFTIVELLVVIVVIGILATITVVSYTGIAQKGIVATLQSDLTNSAKRLKLYSAEHGFYPVSLDTNNCPKDASNTVDNNYCLKASSGNTFTVYISTNTSFGLTEANTNGTTYSITDGTIVTVGPLTTISSAPTNLSAAVGANQVIINWSAPSSNGNSAITNYKVYRSTTSGNETLLTTLGNVLTYNDTGLTSGTTYYYKLTAINGVGESGRSSEISATTTVTYTLAISAGANGTVNIAVNGTYNSGSTPTITATPMPNYLFSSWSGSTGCNGITTASYAITMDGDKSCTANFVADPWVNWYAGVASTALAGKHVYKTDLGSTYSYKTAATAVASPQGSTGLDPNYPSNMSLVSPQTNPGVDFSAYPAQNACKAVGGRLPNTQELSSIFVNRAMYGNNFQVTSGGTLQTDGNQNSLYWSSTEGTSSLAYYVYFNDNSIAPVLKYYTYHVRCISD